MSEVPGSRRSASRRAVVAVVLGGFTLLAFAGCGPGPGEPSATSPATPSGTGSTSPAANASPASPSAAPYQLSLLPASGSPLPATTIRAAADCQSLPTDWLREFCSLTLRSHWRAIIGPTDPFAAPPNATSSVTFLAALARAEIDGDTSLCFDVAMREWLSAGSSAGGAAPPPGSTPVPIQPIATCFESFLTTVRHGSFTVSDPGDQAVVELLVSPEAAAQVILHSTPVLDPYVACAKPLTRADCESLIDAATTYVQDHQLDARSLAAFGQPVECPGSTASCPPPSAGAWLGSVRVGLAGNGIVLLDVSVVGGLPAVNEVAEPTP